jgi:hypothetical protein
MVRSLVSVVPDIPADSFDVVVQPTPAEIQTIRLAWEDTAA